MPETMRIGQLASLTGVPSKTIRYYEDVGLLPAPRRSDSRYRLYTDIDLSRLHLIRRARILDMSLAEIKELVEFAQTDTCSDFRSRFLGVV